MAFQTLVTTLSGQNTEMLPSNGLNGNTTYLMGWQAIIFLDEGPNLFQYQSELVDRTSNLNELLSDVLRLGGKPIKLQRKVRTPRNHRQYLCEHRHLSC